MNSKYRYTGALLALSILASCEKEVNVKLPGYKPKLVINSSTVTGDTIWVTAGKSISISQYNNSKDLSVPDATILLQRSNAATADTLHYDEQRGAYRSATIAEQGVTYSVSVQASGFETASAISSVPEPVPILSVKRFPEVRINADGQPQDELRITFKDPPSKGDYYLITLLKAKSDSFYREECVNTPDASVESIYNEDIDQNTCLRGDEIFIRDELFNGTTKELRLFASGRFLAPEHSGGNTFKVLLVLRHVTEDYFRFRKTYRFASENNDNPFAEPANIHTNVKNGYGVFGISAAATAEVD